MERRNLTDHLKFCGSFVCLSKSTAVASVGTTTSTYRMENSKRKSESSEENGNRKKNRTQNEEDEGVDESEKNSERIPKTKLEKVKEESRETNDFDEEEEEDENVIFEAGMVLKVHMENFMCHSKFTVTLGRMLNFITGANGSGLRFPSLRSPAHLFEGKSAVVAAIQLCLGASARRSGRASRYSYFDHLSLDIVSALLVSLKMDILDLQSFVLIFSMKEWMHMSLKNMDELFRSNEELTKLVVGPMLC
jgi:hypothetical protein